MIETRRWGKAIMHGLITIFAMALIISFIFSMLLKFTGLTEDSVKWVIMGLSFVTLFIGGFVSGGKGKEKGWLIGGLTSLLYTLIILVFQFLGLGSSFSLEQLAFHAGFLLIAMLGGIMGVNLSSSR
ncbi:TIGR04086 family membrane protein [Metabacillus sp. RGM 3146]|uniref:TIGR04086 family membrane protein n=1 Tax=Metabacillus sp. RGM 3146 TaxID=3401092 RepID=UPI003B9D6879